MPKLRMSNPDPNHALGEQLRAQIRAQAAGFDPTQLPLQPCPPPHTPVPAAHWQAAALHERFAQLRQWQPPEVIERAWQNQPLTPSAVLIPIVQRPVPQVLLTQRASSLRNHSGQIAFAGGRVDAQDADAIACALREAYEEIGLEARHIEVIGTLPPYTTGTAFAVTPVVALVQPHYQLHINAQEVDCAFEIPLPHLLDPHKHYLQQFEANGQLRRWYAMPSCDEHGQSRFVWGASAGMLRNLYHFLLA